jgi:hypothetical protein
MNDKERALWIDNDEGLYRLWKASGLSKKKFLYHNRTVVDHVVEQIITGKKPTHYLAYQR